MNKNILFLLFVSFVGIEAMQLSSQNSLDRIIKKLYIPNETNDFLKEMHFSSTGTFLKKIYDDLQRDDGLQKVYFHPITHKPIQLIVNSTRNTAKIKAVVNNDQGEKEEEYYNSDLRHDKLMKTVMNPKTHKVAMCIYHAAQHPEHIEKTIYDDEGNRYVHFREDLRKDGLKQKQEFKDKIIYISNPERSEHHAIKRVFIRGNDNIKKIETIYDENYTKKGLQKTEFHPETGKAISHTYNPEKHPKHITQEFFNENNIKIEEHFDPNLTTFRLAKKRYNPQTGLLIAKFFKPTEPGFKPVQINYDNTGKGTPVFGIIKKIKSNSEN